MDRRRRLRRGRHDLRQRRDDLGAQHQGDRRRRHGQPADGTTTWTGNTGANNNAIRFWNGATVNNNGTFNDANTFASFIEHSVGGPHNFNNIGTYNKRRTRSRRSISASPSTTPARSTSRPARSGPRAAAASSGCSTSPPARCSTSGTATARSNDVTTSGAGTFAISSDLVGADAVVTINGGTHTTPFAAERQHPGRRRSHFRARSPGPAADLRRGERRRSTNDVDDLGRRTPRPSSPGASQSRTARRPGAATPATTTTRSASGTAPRSTTTAPSTTPTRSRRSSSTTSAARTTSTTSAPTTSSSNTITTVDLGVGFNNSGTLNLNAGTMRFVSGTQGPTGTIRVASGATYQHDVASSAGRMSPPAPSISAPAR